MNTRTYARLPFVVVVALVLTLGFPAAASASPYLTGDWEYFQAFSLDNSGNASPVTDFVLALEIDTETLVSQSKMQSNGEDMRFSVGNDACDYWIPKDPRAAARGLVLKGSAFAGCTGGHGLCCTVVVWGVQGHIRVSCASKGHAHEDHAGKEEGAGDGAVSSGGCSAGGGATRGAR